MLIGTDGGVQRTDGGIRHMSSLGRTVLSGPAGVTLSRRSSIVPDGEIFVEVCQWSRSDSAALRQLVPGRLY